MLAALIAVPARAQTVGSANTVTAVPTIPRPPGTPCTVQLFAGVAFADFSSKFFAYTPPANCPGPYSKIVFEADWSVTAGRQFDRTANVWIGGANVYFGTTAEPSRTVARSWHVERDLTDYAPLFASPQPGKTDLGNLVNSRYTGILYGTAALQFYPAAKDERGDALGEDAVAARPADAVLPLASDPAGGTSGLSDSGSALARTFALPRNVERAALDVIAQSQGGDEFWYTCVPDDVAGPLQSCGGGAFRESQISIDGVPAGVAPVYPWIYTGGIDPYLWRPIPGVQTLNFNAYRVELTPFAGLLSDGNPHTVSVSVFGANGYFSTTATLLLWLDRGARQVTGGVTVNTLAPPAPATAKNLATAADGTITGTVGVTSSRSFKVAGWTKTSHGIVTTEVAQTIDFSNLQTFDITGSGSLYEQDIAQSTAISSVVRSKGGGPKRERTQRFWWPLSLKYSFTVAADGSAAQTTVIRQESAATDALSRNGEPLFSSIVDDVAAPADTLVFTAAGAVFPQNQSSTQRYFSADSSGACYSRSIAAAAGVLTSVVDGAGCEAPAELEVARAATH
jgi:hypothetical protein